MFVCLYIRFHVKSGWLSIVWFGLESCAIFSFGIVRYDLIIVSVQVGLLQDLFGLLRFVRLVCLFFLLVLFGSISVVYLVCAVGLVYLGCFVSLVGLVWFGLFSLVDLVCFVGLVWFVDLVWFVGLVWLICRVSRPGIQ